MLSPSSLPLSRSWLPSSWHSMLVFISHKSSHAYIQVHTYIYGYLWWLQCRLMDNVCLANVMAAALLMLLLTLLALLNHILALGILIVARILQGLMKVKNSQNHPFAQIAIKPSSNQNTLWLPTNYHTLYLVQSSFKHIWKFWYVPSRFSGTQYGCMLQLWQRQCH